MDMLRFAGSLVLVLCLLGGLLWALKRMQTGIRPGGGVRQLQVIEAVSVAEKDQGRTVPTEIPYQSNAMHV